MGTAVNLDPPYVARFLQRLAARGFAGAALTYPRPEAGGAVHAYRFTPGSAPRGLALLAHATGSDALFPLLGLITTLLARGLSVFTFDLDGHGRHSSTSLTLTNAGTMVTSAVAVARDAHLPLHLIGHSLGGALALAAVAGGSVAAASLTLISAPVHLAPGPLALACELLSVARPALYAQTAVYGARGIIPAFGSFGRTAYPVRLARPGSYVREVCSIVNHLELMKMAPKVAIPTLLVYGTRDLIASMAQARELASALPEGRLRKVRGATHYTTPFESGVEADIGSFIA